MPITKHEGPVGGIAAINRALPNLIWRGPGALRPRGGAAPVHASQPIQLFILKSSDISNTDFIEKAEPVGWRYLIVDDGPIAVADVSTEGTKPGASFASLIRGPLAERFGQAAALAERRYRADPNDFDVRVLEIPSLYISALWLHGPREVFIPFLEGSQNNNPKEVQEDRSFPSRVFMMAQRTRPIPQPL
jgi:hypothetical protein